MTDISASSPQRSRLIVIVIWILRILLVLAFGAAAFAKLTSVPMMVTEFDKIGVGQWFRYFTGGTELAGVALVLWPRTTFYGALVLICVCLGAFIAQIGPLHGDVVHVIVLGALAALVAWFTRPAAH